MAMGDSNPAPVGASRTVIVTGGGRSGEVAGIGYAISRTLATDGWNVVVCDRSRPNAEATVAEIVADGGSAFSAVGDVTDAVTCATVVAAAVDRFGDLGGLVNNVGVFRGEAVEALTETGWRDVLDINLTSAALMAAQAFPALARSRGTIVNITSIGHLRPDVWSASYAASKAGLEGLTRALAVAGARQGIRANAVRPGQAWTSMAAQTYADAGVARARERSRQASALAIEGTAWDVADAVSFLISAKARWITGEIITVDGGAALLRGAILDA